jgi:hypothetical protein
MSQGPTNFKTMDDVNSGFTTGKGFDDTVGTEDMNTQDMTNMRTAGFSSVSDKMEIKAPPGPSFDDMESASSAANKASAASYSGAVGSSSSNASPPPAPTAPTPAASADKPIGYGGSPRIGNEGNAEFVPKKDYKGAKARDILVKGFEEIDHSIVMKGEKKDDKKKDEDKPKTYDPKDGPGLRHLRGEIQTVGMKGKIEEKSIFRGANVGKLPGSKKVEGVSEGVARKIREGLAESNADRFIKDIDNARSNKWSQHELRSKNFGKFLGEELAQTGRSIVSGAKKVVGVGKRGVERTKEGAKKFNEGLHTPGAELNARQRAAQTARDFPDEEIRPRMPKPEPQAAPKPDVTPDAKPKTPVKKPGWSTGAKVGVGAAGAAGLGGGYYLGSGKPEEEKGMKEKGLNSHVGAMAVGAGVGAYGTKRLYDALEKTDEPTKGGRENYVVSSAAKEGRGKADAKLERGKSSLSNSGMKPIKLEKTKLGKGSSKPKDVSLKCTDDSIKMKEMNSNDPSMPDEAKRMLKLYTQARKRGLVSPNAVTMDHGGRTYKIPDTEIKGIISDIAGKLKKKPSTPFEGSVMQARQGAGRHLKKNLTKEGQARQDKYDDILSTTQEFNARHGIKETDESIVVGKGIGSVGRTAAKIGGGAIAGGVAGGAIGHKLGKPSEKQQSYDYDTAYLQGSQHRDIVGRDKMDRYIMRNHRQSLDEWRKRTDDNPNAIEKRESMKDVMGEPRKRNKSLGKDED